MSYTLQQQELYIEQIKQFTQSQCPLMMVISELPNDETALIEEIVQRLRTNNPIIRINSKPTTSPKAIKNVLCKYWSKVTLDENESIEAQLQTILDNLKSKRQHVLIINQADQLPLTTLAAIAHLAISQKRQAIQLHIMLSGDPSLIEKLHNLVNADIPQITLGAMNFEEAKERIKAHFDKVQINAIDKTTHNVIQHIYQQSHGLPNCMQALLGKLTAEELIGSGNKKQVATRSHGATLSQQWNRYGIRVLALAGLLFTAFFMNWHYHHQVNRLETTPQPQVSITHLHSVKTPIPQIDTQIKNLQSLIQPAYDVTPKPLNMTMSNSIPAKTLSTRPASPQTTPPAAPTQPRQTHRLAAKRFYTLQLMSEARPLALQHYIRAHQLAKIAKIYPSHFNGQAWYLVGYGHYDSVGDARKALNRLPSQLKALRPWIRPMT